MNLIPATQEKLLRQLGIVHILFTLDDAQASSTNPTVRFVLSACSPPYLLLDLLKLIALAVLSVHYALDNYAFYAVSPSPCDLKPQQPRPHPAFGQK